MLRSIGTQHIKYMEYIMCQKAKHTPSANINKWLNSWADTSKLRENKRKFNFKHIQCYRDGYLGIYIYYIRIHNCLVRINVWFVPKMHQIDVRCDVCVCGVLVHVKIGDVPFWKFIVMYDGVLHVSRIFKFLELCAWHETQTRTTATYIAINTAASIHNEFSCRVYGLIYVSQVCVFVCLCLADVLCRWCAFSLIVLGAEVR